MQTVFFEFPSFGFGPASTSCHLIRAVQKGLNCRVVVISSGAGLEFAKISLENVAFLDIDTNYMGRFDVVKKFIPAGSVIISNTNIDFCRWCVEQGYSVIAVDTLFWMWEQELDFIPKTMCYIVQDYYIQERLFNNNYKKYKEHLTVTSPIIRKRAFLQIQAGKNKEEALISLGGMETPFNREIIFLYCEYILPDLVERLCASGIRKIHIVGGLCQQYARNAPWLNRYEEAVTVHGTVSQDQYLVLLACAWQFITPGLTSIYEAYATDVPLYFLPGFSMSQILQSESYRQITDYPYVGQWNGASKIVEKLSTMQEDDGTAYFNHFLQTRMTGGTPFEWPNLTTYMQEEKRSLSAISPQINMVRNRWSQLDDAADTLVEILRPTISAQRSELLC